MGHFIFYCLHLIALLFGAVWLIITIPAHLIYGAVSEPKKDPNAPHWKTHVRCPDCKEFILKEANVCKHCGTKLVPQP